MIVDPGEHVGEVGLRIEVGHLGGLDDGHRVGKGFAAGIGAGEHPVFASYVHRFDGALGRIVIGHADIGVSISRPVFPSVVVVRVSGIGASECEEAGRPNRQ